MKYLVILFLIGAGWAGFQKYQVINTLQQINNQNTIVYAASAEAAEKKNLYVFSDYNCPYCRRFHSHIPKLTAAGYQVHYIFFPLQGKISDTADQMKKIWCSERPNQSLDNYMQGKNKLSGRIADPCPSPMNQHDEWADSLGVNVVPWVMDANGTRVENFYDL